MNQYLLSVYHPAGQTQPPPQVQVETMLAGGSFGQLLSRIAVVRLDVQPLGLPRALLRALLVSLALPALIISTDRRGLHDLAVGTVVIKRR